MNKLLIIITLALFTKYTAAQIFAPIGARWYYTERFPFSGDINFILYTAEKDTLVKGQNCRKIIKKDDPMCWGRPGIELMYSTNDSVFFYDPILDTFQVIYRFSANKNETWFFIYKDYPSGKNETVTITVDSVGSIMANNQSLKVLYVTYDNRYKYQSTIIEKMGDIEFMFNFTPSFIATCDGNYPRGMRCYEDTIIGNYHFANMDSCEYTYNWTGINPITDNNIIIYPNPSNEIIYITGLNQAAYFQMYDINGRLVKLGNLKDAQIQLKELVSGMYVLNICDLTGLKLINKKISKN